MANTYPSLSVKGMIYIHSRSPQICVSPQKTTQGRRDRSEDPVYSPIKVYQNQSLLLDFYRRDKCFIEGNKKKGYVATLLKEKNRNSRSNV